MPLAFVNVIFVRHVARAQRLHDGVGLVTRHDLVDVALEDGDRVDELVRVEYGRTLAVDVRGGGQRAQQHVEIARLELVRLHRQAELVGHAVETDPRAEEAGVIHQRLQDGEAARAAAHDDQALAICQAAARQMLRAAERVLDVADAPVAVEALHVVAPVAGAAAIVHVQHRDAARGEELGARVIGSADLRGRAAVHRHDQRWRTLATVALAVGRVVQPVHFFLIRAAPGQGLHRRQLLPAGVLGGRAPPHLRRAPRVQGENARRNLCRAGHERD